MYRHFLHEKNSRSINMLRLLDGAMAEVIEKNYQLKTVEKEMREKTDRVNELIERLRKEILEGDEEAR